MASNPTKPGKDTWATLDEIQFLDKLGIHAERERLGPTEQEERVQRLFEGARIAYSKRANWGKIDPEAIKQYLEV